jgi:hypothetical protein
VAVNSGENTELPLRTLEATPVGYPVLVERELASDGPPNTHATPLIGDSQREAETQVTGENVEHAVSGSRDKHGQLSQTAPFRT